MAVSLADSTWEGEVKGGGLGSVLAHIRAVEGGRLVIWSPLLLVFGIWGYFRLSQEPSLASAIVALVAAGFILWRWRSKALFAALAIMLAGFGVAKLRTEWVGTPLLRAYVPEAIITGWIREVDHRGKASRLLVIDVETASAVPPDEVPHAVRLRATVKPGTELRIGNHVSLKTQLSPLPRPVAPGAFEYGRQLYFQGIGAMGRVRGDITVTPEPMPWRYLLRSTFHDLRRAIGARVHAVIKAPLGSFAEALITGERASIPRSLNESLQASGLFHILSISGLHMSMVAGGAFWAVRALLAFFPRLALRHPIKKWAAAAALAVGLLYMLLADSGAATERSFIMIAVVFFAVLVDRPAISLHNLAVAAVIILLQEPEQALSASFQMSFMAVMGLAAFFPAFQVAVARFRAERSVGTVGKWFHWLLLLVFTSLATSLIAGVLSSIPAAHHFGRLAPFSIVANALALPIVGIVVMPSAMASVLLMPFGLEALPLKAMELGLGGVVYVSDLVASWSLAQTRWPLLPVRTAILLSLSGALLCLAASRLRWLALPCLVVAGVTYHQPAPDLLVDDRAANVAVLTQAGYVPAVAKGAGFSAGRWLQQSGDAASAAEAAKRPAWSCRDNLCTTVNPVSTAYLRRAAEGRAACPAADIVIAEFPLRARCKGTRLTIDRFDVWRQGSHAIFVDGNALRLKTALQEQGVRPWVYAPRARLGNIFNRKRP